MIRQAALTLFLLQAGPRALFEQGLEKQRAGDLAGARELLEQAARAAPSNFAIHGNLGVVLAQAGDFAGAVKSYQRALALHPQAHRLRLNLAIARVRAGEFSGAAGELRRFLAAEPGNAQGEELLALCFYQLGRYGDSAATYEKLTATQGEKLELLYGLGEAHNRAGNTARAEQAFARLFARFPNAPQTRLLLAQKMLGEGRGDEAVAELRALAATPLPGVPLWLGIALEKTGQPEEALAAYRREITATGDLLAHYGAGVIESRGGDAAKAAAHLRTALPLDGERYNVSYHLGNAYWRGGEPALALPLVRKAVAREPADASGHYLLMQIYRGLGRTAEASREAGIVKKLKDAGLAADRKKVDGRLRSGTATPPR